MRYRRVDEIDRALFTFPGGYVWPVAAPRVNPSAVAVGARVKMGPRGCGNRTPIAGRGVRPQRTRIRGHEA